MTTTTALVQPATVMASQHTARHRRILAAITDEEYIQAIERIWPPYFYAPDSYVEHEQQYADAFNRENGPYYLYNVRDADDLLQAQNDPNKADIDEIVNAMQEYFESHERTFWKFIDPMVNGFIEDPTDERDEDNPWVDAYLNMIRGEEEIGEKVLNLFYTIVGRTEEAREYYDKFSGGLSGGGEHEFDIVIADNADIRIGRSFAMSGTFFNDSRWGNSEIDGQDVLDISSLVTEVLVQRRGGEELRSVLAGAVVPSKSAIVNPSDLWKYADDYDVLAYLIDNDYDLYQDIVRSEFQEQIWEWEREYAENEAYKEAFDDFRQELNQYQPPEGVHSMDWLRDQVIADLRKKELEIGEVLDVLQSWIDEWSKQGVDVGNGSDIDTLKEDYENRGIAHPIHKNIQLPEYERYERIVLLSTEEHPLDDPSLEGQTGIAWDNWSVQLDDGRWPLVDSANIFSEEQAPHEPAPNQQMLPFAQARLKSFELDPLFFSDGKMLLSVREALRKSCGDSFAAFLLLDSINGMKTTPVLNVVAVQSDEQGRKIKGKINGRPVVVHAEDDVPLTWRDAVYDLDNDFWLIPMRSMIALKPEDEIKIGDHVEVGLHSHPAVITDKHENNEYEYDLYTYKDDEGEVKTVEKVQLRQIDENPLRMLPKENDSIVKPKTAQSKQGMPNFSIGDVVKVDSAYASKRDKRYVISSVFTDGDYAEWMYWMDLEDNPTGHPFRVPESQVELVESGGNQLPQLNYFVGDKVIIDGYAGKIVSLWFDASAGEWRYTSWGSDGNYHHAINDQIRRYVPDVYTDDTPVIANRTAASGGTGYGDYQEKITDSSGTGVGGDVSSPHAPVDLAPFDPEEQSKEGSPVPSQEYKKTLLKNRIIKDSVAGRKVDVLASKVVMACKSHMIRKSQTGQGVSVYNTTMPQQPTAPIHNVPVAGNALGGGYQLSETQQDELDANVSENENVSRTQFQQEQNLAQDQFKSQDQANDLQQVFQQQKIDESNRQQSTVAKKAEAAKLKLIFGSEVGAENPASSSLDQIESDDDQTGKSSTDHGRKVLLHDEFSDENAQDSVSYPSQRQEVKPRY